MVSLIIIIHIFSQASGGVQFLQFLCLSIDYYYYVKLNDKPEFSFIGNGQFNLGFLDLYIHKVRISFSYCHKRPKPTKKTPSPISFLFLSLILAPPLSQSINHHTKTVISPPISTIGQLPYQLLVTSIFDGSIANTNKHNH